MKKILIIGKKSFLGSNLKIYLSKFYKVDCHSYEKVIFRDNSFFDKYSHILNTAIHKRYIKKRYDKKYDLDSNFVEKFDKINFDYIYINSRKIYRPKENINENSYIAPVDIYAKNKLITERLLQKKCKNRLVSLRVSNVVGKKIIKNLRNNHKLFFDNFLQYRQSKRKIIVNNDFKDFLSIDQFCLIIAMIIKFKVKGIFNVSISKKIHLSELTKWLDKKLFKKINFTKPSKNSFTLSNTKLIKKIKINLTKNQLKTFCEKLI